MTLVIESALSAKFLLKVCHQTVLNLIGKVLYHFCLDDNMYF